MHLLTTPLPHRGLRREVRQEREGNAIWLSAEMTSPYAFYQLLAQRRGRLGAHP